MHLTFSVQNNVIRATGSVMESALGRDLRTVVASPLRMKLGAGKCLLWSRHFIY